MPCRYVIVAAGLVFLMCGEKRVSRMPLPSVPFSFGSDSSPYPARIKKGVKLPKQIPIANIVRNPKVYADRRVTVTGCYRVDPYHGSVLFDPASFSRGIEMFGGSDDTRGQPFDWMAQQVCGTFVGVIRWKTNEVPLKYLCPELCFVSEGTVACRIEPAEETHEYHQQGNIKTGHPPRSVQ